MVFLEYLKTRKKNTPEIYWPLVFTDIFYLSLIGVTSEDQKGTNNADIPTKSLEDALACLELECNQTFLGMVQMQYQALVDIVQLIDLLEKACIRFVHFRSGSCYFDRVSNDEFSVEFWIFGIVIFFNSGRVLRFGALSKSLNSKEIIFSELEFFHIWFLWRLTKNLNKHSKFETRFIIRRPVEIAWSGH